MVLAQLFKDSLKLSLKDPRLSALVIVVAILQHTLHAAQLPIIFMSVLLLFSVGWFGTKLALLHQARSRSRIDFSQALVYFWQFLKRLLPIVLVLGILGIVGAGIVFGIFTQWFYSRLNLGTELSSSNQTEFLLMAIQNRQIWEAFFRENLFIKVVVQVFAFAAIISKIWARAIVGFMITEQSTLGKAIKQSFRFLSRRLDLIIAFLLLHTCLAILLNIFNLLSSVSSGIVGLTLTYLSVAIQAYGMLILDGFVLLALLADHRPFKLIHALFTSIFSLGARLAHKRP